jgi:hypothetical protein
MKRKELMHVRGIDVAYDIQQRYENRKSFLAKVGTSR